MIVVCDTTPIHYLLLIDRIDLIPKLYGRACVPPMVLKELQHVKAPKPVRTWALSPPGWVSVEEPGEITSAVLLGLHAGERQAIAVAEKLDADFLLTDDRNARRVANARGIATVTTLLILDAAADRGWVNFQRELALLLKTNFRVDQATLVKLAEKHS